MPLGDLPGPGFAETFRDLAQAGFPGAGSYQGSKTNHRPLSVAAG